MPAKDCESDALALGNTGFVFDKSKALQNNPGGADREVDRTKLANGR